MSNIKKKADEKFRAFLKLFLLRITHKSLLFLEKKHFDAMLCCLSFENFVLYFVCDVWRKMFYLRNLVGTVLYSDRVYKVLVQMGHVFQHPAQEKFLA